MKSKVSSYIIWYVSGPHAGKFEANDMAQNLQNLSFLTKNGVFEDHFWQNIDASLQDVSIAETFLMVNYY